MSKCGYCEDIQNYAMMVKSGNITIPLNRLKLCEFCKHLRHSGRVMYGMIDDKNCKCEESR